MTASCSPSAPKARARPPRPCSLPAAAPSCSPTTGCSRRPSATSCACCLGRRRRPGRPLALLVTPDQRHDSVCAQALLDRIRVPRTGLGRPRRRPDHVIADKAYSSRGFRSYLRRRGIARTIPEKTDQQRHRQHCGSRGGRPPGFSREIYRRRNLVERCFNQLKGFRGIATRYEKIATSYEAAVALASLLFWARSVEDGP